MLRSRPYSTTVTGRYRASARGAHVGSCNRRRPQLARNHDHHAITVASRTSGTKMLYCIAEIGWPVNNWWNPRVRPQPGHHRPVIALNWQAGNRLPAAAGSKRATTTAAPSARHPPAMGAARRQPLGGDTAAESRTVACIAPTVDAGWSLCLSSGWLRTR